MARSETGRKGRMAATLPEIPDKLYFRIGEVARLLALPAYVLRFWETEFAHLKPAKGGTGQRLYRRREVDALFEIRRLLYDEGYTIPGARQFLKDKATASGPVALPKQDAGESTSTVVDAATLHKLKAELRAIADLLIEPVPKPTNPAHRGLHLTQKKRTQPERQPALFNATGNPSEERPGEQEAAPAD